MPTFKAFIYETSKERKETPYLTFLRYTNEAERSSRVFSSILHSILRKSFIGGENKLSILDIGSGDGRLVVNVFRKLARSLYADLFLLEPSEELHSELGRNIKLLPRRLKVKIINKKYEDLKGHESFFDIIFASRLYHIARKDRYNQFSKMISQLKVGGHLIFVLRKKDDNYYFKKKFQTKIFGRGYLTGHIEECMPTFRKISNELNLEIKNFGIHSELKIPVSENLKDSISLIEFSLNTKWNEIPRSLKIRVLKYIEKKQNVFKQLDGVAVIKKLT